MLVSMLPLDGCVPDSTSLHFAASDASVSANAYLIRDYMYINLINDITTPDLILS